MSAIQVTPKMLEQASRNLCIIRAVNPDEFVTIPMPEAPDANGAVPAVLREQSVPVWTLYRAEILNFLQLQQAVATGFAGLNPDGSPSKDAGPAIMLPPSFMRPQ